MTGEGQEI